MYHENSMTDSSNIDNLTAFDNKEEPDTIANDTQDPDNRGFEGNFDPKDTPLYILRDFEWNQSKDGRWYLNPRSNTVNELTKLAEQVHKQAGGPNAVEDDDRELVENLTAEYTSIMQSLYAVDQFAVNNLTWGLARDLANDIVYLARSAMIATAIESSRRGPLTPLQEQQDGNAEANRRSTSRRIAIMYRVLVNIDEASAKKLRIINAVYEKLRIEAAKHQKGLAAPDHSKKAAAAHSAGTAALISNLFN